MSSKGQETVKQQSVSSPPTATLPKCTQSDIYIFRVCESVYFYFPTLSTMEHNEKITAIYYSPLLYSTIYIIPSAITVVASIPLFLFVFCIPYACNS